MSCRKRCLPQTLHKPRYHGRHNLTNSCLSLAEPLQVAQLAEDGKWFCDVSNPSSGIPGNSSDSRNISGNILACPPNATIHHHLHVLGRVDLNTHRQHCLTYPMLRRSLILRTGLPTTRASFQYIVACLRINSSCEWTSTNEQNLGWTSLTTLCLLRDEIWLFCLRCALQHPEEKDMPKLTNYRCVLVRTTGYYRCINGRNGTN